jgi:hypothetical protein
MSHSFRPSDFTDGTWDDRHDRDLEREPRPAHVRTPTADDKAERMLFAAGLTCSYDQEPLDPELDELACRGDHEREQQLEMARLEVES